MTLARPPRPPQAHFSSPVKGIATMAVLFARVGVKSFSFMDVSGTRMERIGSTRDGQNPGWISVGRKMFDALVVGRLYSNKEIFKSLKVSNAGGIRLSLQDRAVLRAVIMTSVQSLHGAGENPYHDRLEAGILTYT